MTDPSPPAPSPTLPRRRACTACTTAKAKCTPSARVTTICERCQRLGKQCVYGAIAGTRRLPGDKNSASRRVQMLERKVDSLVAQLNAVSPRQGWDGVESGGGGRGGRDASGSTPSSAQLHTTSQQQSQDMDPGFSNNQTDSTPSSSSRSYDKDTCISWDSSPPSDRPPEHEPVALEARSTIPSGPSSADYVDNAIDYGLRSLCHAEGLLTIFRDNLQPEFPFVLLADADTSESLRADKPFLFLAIVVVASFADSALQRRLGKEMQRQIAERMIVRNEMRGEVGLDLLQGLLVYLAWYHYFLEGEGEQILLLAQLGVTLVNQMGLVREFSVRVGTGCDGVGEGVAGGEEGGGKGSLDEMRAFLGTFYLCSGFSTTFGNLEIMGYTEHVRRCCKKLTKASRLKSDQWLVRLVEFETLVRHVSSTFKYSSPGDCNIRGEDSVCAIVDGFERELESLQVAAQRDAQGHELTLSRTMSFADAWIHEVAFHHQPWENRSSGLASAENQPLPHAQTRMLWQNLATSQRYFDDFISVENGKLFHLTFVTWVRLCYMLAVCCKVIFFNVEKQPTLPSDAEHGTGNKLTLPSRHQPSWDSLSAAKKADFQRIGGLIEIKIRAAEKTGRDDEKRDAIAQFAHCMGGIMSSYERQLQAVSSKGKGNDASAQNGMARLDIESSSAPATDSSNLELSGQGTNIGTEMDWDVPMDFQTDNLEDIVWESLMQDFTIFPQQ